MLFVSPLISAIHCGSPGKGMNAYVEVDSLTFGGKANYTCFDGYITSDATVATCLQNATWDLNPPTCKSIKNLPHRNTYIMNHSRICCEIRK